MTKEPRKYLGQKKEAPVDMRKESHQFVIDGYLVEEVLNQIPAGIKILGASVTLRSFPTTRRIAVPTKLKAMGVARMATMPARDHAWLVFDEVAKSTIIRNTKAVCESMNQSYDKAYFEYLLLSNAEATGKFEHCTKEVRPNEADQRKKLRVLGLTTGKGKVQGLISELGAKKYKCEIREQSVRLLMCSQG